METATYESPKHFSLKNRQEWSDNRFAWFYASLILAAVVVLMVILKVSGVYESMAWRIINLFFILFGFIWLVRDYRKHRSHKVTYIKALLLCIRTGFYFALLFLPALIIVVWAFPVEQAIIENKELYSSSNYPVQGIVFANYIETAAAVPILAYVSALFTNIGKSPRKNDTK